MGKIIIMYSLIILCLVLMQHKANGQDTCDINDHSIDTYNFPYREGDLHQCQYAGTLGYQEPFRPYQNHQFFYWYFKHLDEDAPLIVYINGGPGRTSMDGLFLENGPLRVARNGTGSEDFVLTAAPESWADDYDVLYVDQPVSAGFSYGSPLLTNLGGVSRDFIRFLSMFMAKYKDIKKKRVYLAGEGYAGKYLSYFTNDIIDYNKKNVGDEILLTATILINPLISPVIQQTNMASLLHGIGLLDQNNLNQLSALEQKCELYQTENSTEGFIRCNDRIMEYIGNVTGNVSASDARMYGFEDAKSVPYVQMLNASAQKGTIYELLHVNESTKDPKFEPKSDAVAKALQADLLNDYSIYVNRLLDLGFPVIVMAGEFDAKYGSATQYAWMKKQLNIPQSVWDSARQVYYFNGTNATDSIVGGQFFQHKNFTFITVPKSGHSISSDYYAATKAFLKDITKSQGQLACHDGDTKCSVTSNMCASMSNCGKDQGKGTCQSNGQCKCANSKYKGSDCSLDAIPAHLITQQAPYSNVESGTKWHYLVFDKQNDNGRDFETEISLDTTSNDVYNQPSYDVYISWSQGVDSNPNEFNHDASFTNISAGRKLYIRDEMIQGSAGYVASVKVSSYNYTANKPIQYKLSILSSRQASDSPGQAAKNTTVAIVVSCLVVFVLLFVAVVLYVLKKRRNRYNLASEPREFGDQKQLLNDSNKNSARNTQTTQNSNQ